MRAEEETLEALKQGQYHYAEDDGTLEVLKEGAGGHELQKRVDEMRQLQTLIDDLRASEKTLNALTPGLSQYELQQMLHHMREMCADGSAGGVGPLEEQIVDEVRAGDGTLEALKQGIPNGRKISEKLQVNGQWYFKNMKCAQEEKLLKCTRQSSKKIQMR